MEDFFINGETKKLKIVRAQAYSEALAGASSVMGRLVDEIISKAKEITGTDEPYEMTDKQGKETLMAVMELVLSTTSGISASSRQQEKLYYDTIEMTTPELVGLHYGVKINYGKAIDEEAVVSIHSISSMPSEIH